MGTDRLVYFRTDGNSRIATGHLVRCLSIADACFSLGMKVCFLVSDSESKTLLQDFDPARRFPIRILKTAVYDDPEKELPELLAVLSGSASLPGFPADLSDTNVISNDVILFLDSYYVTERYLSFARAAAKTAYLDDLRLFDYPADLVINYDVIPESGMPSYRAAYQNAARTLLGASYAPLRRQFSDLHPGCRGSVSNILVTTGGSDPYHFCLKLIEAFRQKQTSDLNDSGILPSGEASVNLCQLHVVAGRLNGDKDELYQLAAELSFLRLHENVSDMASLMADCDLAVSAAGTTLYELCAAGVPSVSFCLADNQLTAARAFDEEGVIPCAGDIRFCCDDALVRIMGFLTDMSKNFQKRKAVHEAMRRLVDGKGAVRIAEALDEL